MYEVLCSVLLQEPVTQRFPRFEVCSLHFPNNQTQLQPSIKCVSKLYGINLNSIQMGVQVNPHVTFTSHHIPTRPQHETGCSPHATTKTWNPLKSIFSIYFVDFCCISLFLTFFFVDFGYFYSSPGPSGPPSFAANSQIEDDRVTRIDFLDHRKYMEIWRISDGYRRIQSILKNRFLQFLTTPKWFCRHCEAGTWWPTETKIAWERQRRRQRRQR